MIYDITHYITVTFLRSENEDNIFFNALYHASRVKWGSITILVKPRGLIKFLNKTVTERNTGDSKVRYNYNESFIVVPKGQKGARMLSYHIRICTLLYPDICPYVLLLLYAAISIYWSYNFISQKHHLRYLSYTVFF